MLWGLWLRMRRSWRQGIFWDEKIFSFFSLIREEEEFLDMLELDDNE